MADVKITLGDEVKDSVSGFQGIAVCRHTYLCGCDRIAIQPPVNNDDGKLPEPISFDEPQLIIVTPEKVKNPVQKNEPTGGPDKYPDTGKIEGGK